MILSLYVVSHKLPDLPEPHDYMSQGHSFIVPSSLGIWIMFHPLHSCTCTCKYLQITGFSVVVFHKKKS